MSVNKQPSYVGINEKEGTYTIAFLADWYNADRCDFCPRFKKAVHLSTRRTVAFCECMEEEKPCEVTGERYGEENDVKTRTS